MHTSRVFFKISDVVNHPLRNYPRYGKTTVVKNLRYGEGKYRRMDFYFSPEIADENGKLPVFFNVHGGGFVCGGKRYRSAIARRYAAKGFFVVNIDYSLAPKHKFPEGTRDCITALDSLAGFSERFPQMDTDTIIISGDSAGGYYAAHAVSAIYSDTLAKELDLPEYTAAKPKALLNFFTPFDPVKCLDNPAPMGITEDIGVCLFGTSSGDSLPYPENFISVPACVTDEWCPVCIIAGERDMFCGGQEREMAAALERAGVEYSMYVAREKGDAHCTHLYPFMRGTPKIFAAADEFLENILKGRIS